MARNNPNAVFHTDEPPAPPAPKPVPDYVKEYTADEPTPVYE